MLRYCWQHHITRWDLFLEETPESVWEVWQLWMARNPDHPAHRDQLACQLAAMQLETQDVESATEMLMRIRLRDPSLTDRPVEVEPQHVTDARVAAMVALQQKKKQQKLKQTKGTE